MKALYTIGDVRFIVEHNSKKYIISTTKKTVYEVTDDDVQSVLRQGYWQVAKELSQEKREELTSLIS